MSAPNTVTPHLNSRPKRQLAGDEEATSQLKLGEFQNTPTLNLSEARIIINAVVAQRRKSAYSVSESEVLTKTTEYLEQFAKFKEQERVQAVERLLFPLSQLESFERSQLGTYVSSLPCRAACRYTLADRHKGALLPRDVEEAKALVPSLEGKVSDEELLELLMELERVEGLG